jgi:hypothetical protein
MISSKLPSTKGHAVGLDSYKQAVQFEAYKPARDVKGESKDREVPESPVSDERGKMKDSAFIEVAIGDDDTVEGLCLRYDTTIQG